MIRLRSLNVLVAAVALAALSFSMPASANDDASLSATAMSEVSSADVVLPRARPAPARQRVAFRAAPRRVVPRQAYQAPVPYQGVVAPYRRVVAHVPMLMLGIGF
jgi:hypothetical protein